MTPTFSGWPRISTSLVYEDAKKAIARLWWFFERLKTGEAQ